MFNKSASFNKDEKLKLFSYIVILVTVNALAIYVGVTCSSYIPLAFHF